MHPSLNSALCVWGMLPSRGHRNPGYVTCSVLKKLGVESEQNHGLPYKSRRWSIFCYSIVPRGEINL